MMRKISIKEWADDDQPRKKLLYNGPDTLSNSELLAILINNGTDKHTALDLAKKLLQSVDNNISSLAGKSVQDIVNYRIKGLGPAKAANIAAALELGIRRNIPDGRKALVTKSDEIANYLRATLGYRKKEIFAVVFLNRSNKINHTEIISAGGLTATIADPRIIFRKALEHEATAIILCHNHPGGNPRPSKIDELLTAKIKQAAALLDIAVLDHIIVSNEGYFSFADAGLLV